MADPTTEQLREMAAHRGLKLVASRRRKPGGDFGRYGLKDAGGEALFGIGQEGLTASAEDIETYLRGSLRDIWSKSAGTPRSRARAKTAARTRPKPAPKPKPKPRLTVKVDNLFDKLPAARRDEAFTELLARPGVRLERIVSRGQATPQDAPMVQQGDEWVVLLQGAAGIRIEDSDEVTLGPGDHLMIAAGRKHWVTWTAKDRRTVWIALHLE